MKNKIKKQVLFLLLLLFISVGSFLPASTSYAINSSYDTAMDALYATTYKDIFYNKTAGSPLEYEAAEGVDAATGQLTLQREDLELEGTGGMDFSLSRYYNSTEAAIGYPSVEHVDTLEVDNIQISFTGEDGKKHTFTVSADIYNNHADALKGMFIDYEKEKNGRDAEVKDTQRTKVVDRSRYNVYGISSGWAFDFPWIETMTIKEGEESQWAEKPIYLHLGSRGSMAIATRADSASKTYSITGLEGYEYTDVKLEDIEATIDGVACRYLLRDKTGLRTYFNKDGVIVLQKDAHNNTIRYTYRDTIYFDTIVDSVGRNIVFHYGEETENGQRFLQKVTVQGEKSAGGVSQKTIRYAISETSYKPKNGKKLYGSRLNSATVDGSRETYGYRTVETLVNTSGWRIAGQRADTNQSYLIKSIESDGSISRYEYRAGALRGTRDAVEGMERDVATQFYYVTREYEEDASSGKKANGIKYDYFQKQAGKKEPVSFADFYKDNGEARQYGEAGLQQATVVSTYNPKKHKDNNRYSDYTYETSDLNADTLHLKNKPKKNISLYIYNKNKLLENQVEDGREKRETLYRYDKAGEGSLLVQETEKEYGTNRSKNPKTSQRGYTYDSYRNMLTARRPKAYLAKYAGKEALFTQTYTYFHTGEGYPADHEAGYTRNEIESIEEYANADTKTRILRKSGENGVDIISEEQQVQEKNEAYRTIERTDYTQDAQGNVTTESLYPSYYADGKSEMIQNNYAYNEQGQLYERKVKLESVKNPDQNQTYIESSSTYDSFGNLLSHTDQNGIKNQYTYDEETGEEIQSVYAVGTEYESREQPMLSEDKRKSMTFDNYDRCTVEIQDAYGNTVITKDEKAGTWTESVYDYGSETEEEEEDGVTGQLLEERTYAFHPEGDKRIKQEDGTEAANYDIAGKGNKILAASRYVYNEYEEEIVNVSFSGGGMDAAHCSEWELKKQEEIVSEDGETTTLRNYTKQLDPKQYQQEVDVERYYTQFDSALLSETIEESIQDAEGNTVKTTTTYKREGNISESVTEYVYDEFGNEIQETITKKKYQNGKWLTERISQNLYQYDYQENITEVEIRSRRGDEDTWKSQTVRSVYDESGQMVADYTSRGVQEGYAATYEYDLLGRQIQVKTPIEKENGTVQYQTQRFEYDRDGNVIAEEEEISDGESTRTEYVYDERGNLVLVKNCLEDGEAGNGEKAVYTQYVYDTEGNKIRQYTGMTSPLTIALKEGEGSDTYHYVNKDYHIEITGKAKKDIVSETKYAYNKKDQLISLTDPEGRKETYRYDVYGNLKKTIDKNGNIIINHYDTDNQLIKKEASEKETGETSSDTYGYNSYGEINKQGNIQYEYGDVSGQITKKTVTLAGGKEVSSSYEYDVDDNCTSLVVRAGNKTVLNLQYKYDTEGNITEVWQTEGGRTDSIARYSYDLDGNRSNKEIPAIGAVTEYEYNLAGWLTEMKNQTKGKQISQYSSSYLKNGQKSREQAEQTDEKGKTEKSQSTYVYDRMGRLTHESKTGEADISYQYDAHNNRVEMKTGNITTAYRYNKNDELERTDALNEQTKQDDVTVYKYDPNGNELAVVHRIKESETPYFDLDVTLGNNRLNNNVVNHYDVYNQLREVLTKDKKVLYEYTPDGMRSKKSVNGKETIYIWDRDKIIMELDESGAVKRRYIHGEDLLYTDEGEESDKQYYIMNPHGDVVQLVGEDGGIEKTYEYDSFGNEIEPDAKDKNPFRYAGEYYDKETETMYLRARYYNPALGRFMTRDTYTGEEEEPLSLHLYTYCQNDAVNNIDPTGHWTGAVHKEITRHAIKEFEKSAKKKLKKKIKRRLRRGSVRPDETRDIFKEYKDEDTGYVMDTSVLSEDEKKVIKYGWFYKKVGYHGTRRKKVDKLKEEYRTAVRYFNTDNVQKYIALGAVLHAIEDYYAHSYCMDIAKYKSFKGSDCGDPNAEVYHQDYRWGLKLDEKRKVWKWKWNFFRDKHRDTKDCATQDFVKGNWKEIKKQPYKKNKRLTKAIKECYEFLQTDLPRENLFK